jgi:phosphonate transport system substrate-binding protein
MKLKLPILLLLLVAQLLLSKPSSAAQTLRVGIVPQQSAAALAKVWVPVLSYLQERTGLILQFETAKDIPTFEQRLAAGEYDIAYMNPYHYIVFHAAPGYSAFAREKDTKLQGLIVVHKNSPIKSVAELEGKTMAFPAPGSFAATILPLTHLKSLGIRVTPNFASSHDSVYLGVARGFFPAGGGIARTFDNIPPEIRNELRILWKTPQYTPHALAAHPRLPAPTVRALQSALMGMDADPRGKELLVPLNFKGFEQGRDADWNDIRKLGIRALENVGQDIAGGR